MTPWIFNFSVLTTVYIAMYRIVCFKLSTCKMNYTFSCCWCSLCRVSTVITRNLRWRCLVSVKWYPATQPEMQTKLALYHASFLTCFPVLNPFSSYLALTSLALRWKSLIQMSIYLYWLRDVEVIFAVRRFLFRTRKCFLFFFVSIRLSRTVKYSREYQEVEFTLLQSWRPSDRM